MSTITYSQAVSVLPQEAVHLFWQSAEGVRVLKGKTVPRAEAEMLLSNAETIKIDNTLEGNHPVSHGISVREGRGSIFFQTDPDLLAALSAEL
jgi:hypothetical protein